jgi:hypothetical protein
MILTGSTNLHEQLKAPQPMLMAATMLRIPGFAITHENMVI